MYIDLIRDLGARRGEAEWNVGFGLSDRQRYDEIEMLVEYEFAPIDRLGLEIELPVTLYSGFPGERGVPRDRLESLKLAAQRTLVADTARSLSFALGYIHQFRLVALDSLTRTSPLAGNAFNPFAVIAKRWGTNWHTLVYAGAEFDRPRGGTVAAPVWEWHSNVHYLVSGTRNFVGVEVNKYLEGGALRSTFRPQMRLAIRDNLLLGLVVAVPAQRSPERLGTFFRLIWEPKPH